MKQNERAKKILPLIVVLFWFAQYIYIPFQTPYLTSLGISAGLIGMIVGAYGISQMVMRLPVGLMADHVGRHKIFIGLGGVFAASGSLMRVIFCNEVGFLIGNLFSGLASAMWICYMVRYTGFFSEQEQQQATAKILFFNNTGILAAFVCSTLLYSRTSMRFLCVLSMTSGLIAAILTLGMEKEMPTGERPGIKELLPICLNRKLVIFSLLAIVQQGIQMSTAMSFTNQVLSSLGASDGVIGLSSIFYMICSVGFAYLASSGIVKKIGAKRIIVGSFLLVGMYCVCVPLAGNIPVVFLLQALPGLSSGILFSTLTSQAMQEVPKYQKSTAMGFFQAVYALGMTVFPIFTGEILNRFDMDMAYYALAALAVIAGLISIFCFNNKKNS